MNVFGDSPALFDSSDFLDMIHRCLHCDMRRMQGPWDVAGAIRAFKSQFTSKTGTAWEERHSMTAKAGKYMWLERDYNDDEEEPKEKAGKKKGKEKEKEQPEQAVKARPELQDLVKFIFNTTFIDAHLAEMNYDANKLPLGKLAKSTILSGFGVLKVPHPLQCSLPALPPSFYCILTQSSAF